MVDRVGVAVWAPSNTKEASPKTEATFVWICESANHSESETLSLYCERFLKMCLFQSLEKNTFLQMELAFERKGKEAWISMGGPT